MVMIITPPYTTINWFVTPSLPFVGGVSLTSQYIPVVPVCQALKFCIAGVQLQQGDGELQTLLRHGVRWWAMVLWVVPPWYPHES